MPLSPAAPSRLQSREGAALAVRCAWCRQFCTFTNNVLEAWETKFITCMQTVVMNHHLSVPSEEMSVPTKRGAAGKLLEHALVSVAVPCSQNRQLGKSWLPETCFHYEHLNIAGGLLLLCQVSRPCPWFVFCESPVNATGCCEPKICAWRL